MRIYLYGGDVKNNEPELGRNSSSAFTSLYKYYGDNLGTGDVQIQRSCLPICPSPVICDKIHRYTCKRRRMLFRENAITKQVRK